MQIDDHSPEGSINDEESPGDYNSVPSPDRFRLLAGDREISLTVERNTLLKELFEFLWNKLLSVLRGKSDLQDVKTSGQEFIREKAHEWCNDSEARMALLPFLFKELPGLIQDCVDHHCHLILNEPPPMENLSNYKVEDLETKKRLRLLKEFDLSRAAPDKDWITGAELNKRWRVSDKELLKHVQHIPIHLFSWKSNSWMCINRKALWPGGVVEIPREAEWILKRCFYIPESWSWQPSWWKLERKNLKFYEKLTPELETPSEDLTTEWLTFDELMERWKVSPFKVEQSIRDRGLKAQHLDSEKGIDISDDTFLGSPSLLGQPMKTMCLYDVNDVRTFERNEKTFLGINERFFDRIQAQELFREWVRKDPTLKPGEGVKMLRATRLFDHLSRDETLAGYIRHLAKNHTPGPRKKI